MNRKPKLFRITTVPISLKVLLKGQMRFMQENGFDVTMVSSDGPEIDSLKLQENCRHITVTLTRKITPIKDLISLIKLTILFIKHKPDIVHTHTPKAGLIGMWAAFFARVPVRLHTIAGLPWVETKGKLRKLLMLIEKLTAFPAHAIFPNSFKQMEFMREMGIAKNKMKVLGYGSSNGIDAKHFSQTPEITLQASALKQQSGIKEGGWIWVFVGRVVKDKGIAELIGAFSSLHQSFPQDQLWLVGNLEPELDPLNAIHMQLIENHPGIKWWDYQQDVRPFLAASDVLTFPSYREGFPNVPLQAGLLGCALILSNINGCNEIVEDGKNGMLVAVKSETALLEAMLKLRNNSSLKDHLAQNIKEKVAQQYDQKKLWNTLLETYNVYLQKSNKV